MERNMRMEPLEDRRMMAVGPQLAGILANDGALLTEGAVRDIAPNELRFRFSDGQEIDPATLGGIQVVRSGFDGTFSRASVFSDMNSDGQVVIEFRAKEAGEGGNHLSVAVTKSDHGDASGPTVNVVGNVVNVDLNTNLLNRTDALDLVNAINSDPAASQLIEATILRGFHFADLSILDINYSPLQLGRFNSATAISDLGTNTNLQALFEAVTPGIMGNGISIEVTKSDHSLTNQLPGPIVTVEDLTISVDLDTNPTNQTTVSQFVNAINSHPQASQLVRITVPVGDISLNMANRVIDYSPIRLGGITDVEVVPGYIGIGDRPNEVVMRFQESLPDDVYLVEVFGSGPMTLRNVDGCAFNDTTDDGIDYGPDYNLEFELDLGAQVVSVVPQPVVRNPITNALQQERRQVWVYFNRDDLSAPSAENPNFYKLIFTNDTVTNADDTEYTPVSVDYDDAQDLAILTFANDLDLLGSGEGTFRLRIGTDEATPPTPISGGNTSNCGH